jgi:hypothetical protein
LPFSWTPNCCTYSNSCSRNWSLACRTHVSSSSCEFKDSFRPRTLDACTQDLTLDCSATVTGNYNMYAYCKEYVFEDYTFWNMCVLNCLLLLESRCVDICRTRKQIVTGPLHDWLQFPYHFAVPSVLLCSRLLRSCPALSRDHPQVVSTAQPERNQHVAPQHCGYVLGIPVTSCGTEHLPLPRCILRCRRITFSVCKYPVTYGKNLTCQLAIVFEFLLSLKSIECH